MAADSLQKQQKLPRGRPFAKGRSGNPAGRIPGSKNKATLLAEQLFDNEASALARKAVEMALAGDAVAMRLCLDRVVAPRRERAVAVAVPAVRSAADLGQAMAAIADAATQGRITPGQAAELAQVFETYIRALATDDFERRLQQLEEMVQRAARG